MQTERRTLSTREVAGLLGVTEHTVGRMAQRGELPVVRAGRKWLFPTGRFFKEVLGEQPPGHERSEH